MLVELFEERSKQSWSTEPDLRQSLLVCRQNVHNSTFYFWVVWISVDREAVIHTVETHVPRNTSKTEEWEAFIIIIGFNYLTYLPNSFFVLIILPEKM